MEIADDMEKDAKECSGSVGDCGGILKMYAKMLRRTVKASVGSQSAKLEIPDWQKEATMEFRKDKSFSNKIETFEKFQGQMMEIVDGPLSGDGDPILRDDIPSGGKVGAEIVIDGSYVYRLGESNKLYYVSESTLKYSESKLKKNGGLILGG
jgi:hypothetical protein